MPAPITHLVYGQQYLCLRPELDRGAFLRGTIFPDIRYLAGFERSKTHQPFTVANEELDREPSAWRAGYLFHNWLDDAWNEYFVRYGLVFGDPTQTPKWSALKLLEERLVRERIAYVEDVASVLDVADPEAVEFGVKPEILERWGWFNADLLRNSWLSDSWDRYVRDALGNDEVAVAEW